MELVNETHRAVYYPGCTAEPKCPLKNANVRYLKFFVASRLQLQNNENKTDYKITETLAHLITVELIFNFCFIIIANDHAMLKTPVLVRSPKLSNIGRG